MFEMGKEEGGGGFSNSACVTVTLCLLQLNSQTEEVKRARIKTLPFYFQVHLSKIERWCLNFLHQILPQKKIKIRSSPSTVPL